MTPEKVLTENMISQLPFVAYHVPGTEIEEAVAERGSIPLFAWDLFEDCPWLPPFDPGMFVGAARHDNGKEVLHTELRGIELYLGMRGAFRMECQLGRVLRDYVVRPGDILAIPAGTDHHLTEWLEKPGLVYVFRTPTRPPKVVRS